MHIINVARCTQQSQYLLWRNPIQHEAMVGFAKDLRGLPPRKKRETNDEQTSSRLSVSSVWKPWANLAAVWRRRLFKPKYGWCSTLTLLLIPSSFSRGKWSSIAYLLITKHGPVNHGSEKYIRCRKALKQEEVNELLVIGWTTHWNKHIKLGSSKQGSGYK